MQANESKQITSSANPKIKLLVKMRKKPSRDDTGLILIDGIREIRKALENNIRIEEVYYCKDLLKDSKLLEVVSLKNCSLFEVSISVFSKIAFGDRREGIVALAQRPKINLEQLKVNKDSIFVVVENIEKPGNLGAIIRTCDAAGISALIVCDNKTDIYNPNVIRGSLGGCFCLPLVECLKQEAIRWLKSQHINIMCATPGAKTNYWQANLNFPCAVVLGSEDKGVSDDFKTASDFRVSIPMKGKIDSLNVSASAAIILYEILRRKTLKPI
ncbi:MAG: RNA methyltransferase [Candidatus Omnitrophota bacterium]